MNIKTIALITATVLGCGSLLATNNTYADTPITIPFEDVNMCNAVAGDIGSDKIEENNCSDETNPNIIMIDSNIESITELHLNNRNISKITGIECFTSLTELYLNDNQITDLTPLKDLTSLTHLDLDDNQITDLAPLKDLTSLTELYLNDNQITDLAPLKDLTSLTELRLENNQITDLTPLSNLTSLTRLYLNNNQITDLTPLKDLTSLTHLDLDNNQISDLIPLKDLTSLTYLDLDNNQISDLIPLKDLTSLTYLYLRHNQIADLTPLSSFTNLESLNIANNLFFDITPILQLNLIDAPFLEGDPPLFALSDTSNIKEYVLPSLFQFFNATLDVTSISVANWVTEGQEMMRQMKDEGILKFELQNAVMNEDGKSITILDTNNPAVVNLYLIDVDEKMLMTSLTVTYEEPVDPVGPTDDPAVPNTGKSTQESSAAILTATLCILSGIVLTAIPMIRVYRKYSK